MRRVRLALAAATMLLGGAVVFDMPARAQTEAQTATGRATGALACDRESDQQALNGDRKTTITFRNRGNALQKVFWIDYDGKRKFYRDLKPGQSYKQETFVTHPWMITDGDDKCLGIFPSLGRHYVAEIKVRSAKRPAPRVAHEDADKAEPRLEDERDSGAAPRRSTAAIERDDQEQGDNESGAVTDLTEAPRTGRAAPATRTRRARRDEPVPILDCSRPASRTDEVICARPGLRFLNARMEAALEDLRAVSPARRSVQIARLQRRWLVRREDCGGRVPCIRRRTRQRIRGLRRRAREFAAADRSGETARRTRRGDDDDEPRVPGRADRSDSFGRSGGFGDDDNNGDEFDADETAAAPGHCHRRPERHAHRDVGSRAWHRHDGDACSAFEVAGVETGGGFLNDDGETAGGGRDSGAEGGERSRSAAPLPIGGESFGGRVRRGPTRDSDQIGSLREGDRLTILEDTGEFLNGYNWFRIRFAGGRTGYQWGGLICSNRKVEGLYRVCR